MRSAIGRQLNVYQVSDIMAKYGIIKQPCGGYVGHYYGERQFYKCKSAAEAWVRRQRVHHELDNGLDDSEYCMSISELAEIMGISKQRVRQLEQRALLKLRAALESEV